MIIKNFRDEDSNLWYYSFYLIKMYKYSMGLVIGRFQPLHNGHVYLIKKALEVCEKIIIVIGSSNIENLDNPFSYTKRRSMVLEFLKQEGLKDRVVQIISSPDIPDDILWRDRLLAKAKNVDIVIGNNDEGVNRFFEQAGYTVLRVPYFKRYKYEGQKIRKLMRENKKWEDRVPEYIAKQINTKIF